MTDGMIALFVSAGLFIVAGTLAVQSMEIHQRSAVKYQATLVGRQVMELWKADQPLPREISLSGHRYEIRYRQRAEQNGYVLWEVEVGDEGGKQFSCRRLVPSLPTEWLDDDGSVAGHDASHPDRNGLPTRSQPDRSP